MFDTTLLRSFHAVAQDSSFTKAAGRLNLTQSAVSAHIRRLEEQAGATLLLRNTRSVALTPQGEVLLGYARAILRLNEDARLQLSGAPEGVHIRIGATDDLMSTWLPGVLQQFRRAHPSSTLEVRVNNAGLLLAAMEQGELDLVVCCRCYGDQAGQVLWREPLLWVCADDDTAAEENLLPLALFPDPCPYRDAALAALAAAGREWRIAAVSPSVAGLRSAVSSGLGISPLNRSAVTAQMRVLGPEAGLPELPEVEFVIYLRLQEGPQEIASIAKAIKDAAHRRFLA
jgi:DNA-binding transcriptional LysR family regulator